MQSNRRSDLSESIITIEVKTEVVEVGHNQLAQHEALHQVPVIIIGCMVMSLLEQ